MSIFDTPPSTDAAAVTPGPAPAPEVPAAPPVDTPPVEPVAPAPESPSVQYVDTEALKDHMVKLKIGGEDVEVPFGEALASAMRGQDYTRKTQALSEERRRLAQADALASMLDADPVDMIRRMAEAYDLDASGLVPVQRTPEEQRAVEHSRMLKQQEDALNRQRVQFEINQLKATYGVADTDLPAIADFAVSTGTNLETAYKAMQFEQLRQQQESQRRAEAAQNAARNAQVVQQGASGGRNNPAPGKPVNSLQEAFELAQQQLGFTS